MKYQSHFVVKYLRSLFLKYLKDRKMCFFGPGIYKLKTIIKHQNAFFLDNFIPSAQYLTQLAYKGFGKSDFSDIAYFEPLYLKNFIPTKSSKINK